MVYEPTKEELQNKDENTVWPSSEKLEQEKMENFLESLDKHVY